jgi:UDP-GlcNAc:undecaprenyl-phosphate GlcNAc-1-phosphate transferase
MRQGLNRRITAFTLWGFAVFYGLVALSLYTWPDSLGKQLIALGSLAWLVQLVYFLRIPSEG